MSEIIRPLMILLVVILRSKRVKKNESIRSSEESYERALFGNFKTIFIILFETLIFLNSDTKVRIFMFFLN